MKYLCFALILMCSFGINERWFEGVNVQVYSYGIDRDSRFFQPNLIKIYNNCRNPDVLIHELAHFDNRKIGGHNSFFLLSYYRIKFDRKI